MPPTCFNPKREAHPLQTSSTFHFHVLRTCFNPKREAHPLQTLFHPASYTTISLFQSQTGSPSSSDDTALDIAGLSHKLFQSQTGSPSSSDRARLEMEARTGEVSIPNGKPILFRRAARRYSP